MPGSITTSPWQRGESLAIEKIKAIQRRLENPKRNQPYIVMQHDTHNWNDANTMLSTGMVKTDVLMMKRWWLRWWVMACGKTNIWLILHLMLICESQESPFVRPLLSLCSTIVTNIIRWITMMASTIRITFRSFQFVFKFWLNIWFWLRVLFESGYIWGVQIENCLLHYRD